MEGFFCGFAIHDRTNVPASHGRHARLQFLGEVLAFFCLLDSKGRFPWDSRSGGIFLVRFSQILAFLIVEGEIVRRRRGRNSLRRTNLDVGFLPLFNLLVIGGRKMIALGHAMVDSVYQRIPALLLCTFRNPMTHVFTTAFATKPSAEGAVATR
jgi:hypothetical protein